LEAQVLLDGDYELGNFDNPAVRLLLDNLKRLVQPLADHATKATINEEEFRSKLHVQHLGHFKLLLARHKFSDVVTDEDTSTPADIEKRNGWI
jgi:hypothetical protein